MTLTFVPLAFVVGWALGILAGLVAALLALAVRDQTHPRTPASSSEAAETDGHAVDTDQPQTAECK